MRIKNKVNNIIEKLKTIFTFIKMKNPILLNKKNKKGNKSNVKINDVIIPFQRSVLVVLINRKLFMFIKNIFKYNLLYIQFKKKYFSTENKL